MGQCLASDGTRIENNSSVCYQCDQAIVNCQGHTKEYFQGHTKDGKALKESNYDSVKITFSFGAGSNGGGH